jgi:ABC-type sugar transport system substrate-binding protein
MMGRHSRKVSRLLAAAVGCVAAALVAPAAQEAGKTVYLSFLFN